MILGEGRSPLSAWAEIPHLVEVLEPVLIRSNGEVETAVVEELEHVLADPPVKPVRAERGERHRVSLLLLAETEMPRHARVHAAHRGRPQHLGEHPHPPATALSHGRRDRSSAEAIQLFADAVDRQDCRVIEGAREVGLVRVAQVMLEVKEGLCAREVLAELVVRIRIRSNRTDVLVRLHHEIDARRWELRLSRD